LFIIPTSLYLSRVTISNRGYTAPGRRDLRRQAR
jgi:hypothetical protein